jgi:F-type H+-transporting ATPase subunit delta
VAKRIYARRYSQAVFNIALERKELDKWQADLKKMAALGRDAAFIALMENPKFGFDKKKELLSRLLDDVNPLALNLVYLLASRGSLNMVGDIADDYHRRLDDYRGIEHAEVVTAVPLGDEEKRRLEEHLGVVVGKKVVLTASVDPRLIGGMVARVGGKLLDGSVRSRLMALKSEIASGGVR